MISKLSYLDAGREKTETLCEMYASYIEHKTQVLTKRCAKYVSLKILIKYIKNDI